jgi:hypothetical protein
MNSRIAMIPEKFGFVNFMATSLAVGKIGLQAVSEIEIASIAARDIRRSRPKPRVSDRFAGIAS